MGFWGRGIMDSSKIGLTSTGQGMGTSALGMGWSWWERSRNERQREFLQQWAVPGSCSWIFLGVPPGGCLSLVALVLSDRIGALLRVQGNRLVQVMSLACSFIFLVLMERNFSVGKRIGQA